MAVTLSWKKCNVLAIFFTQDLGYYASLDGTILLIQLSLAICSYSLPLLR